MIWAELERRAPSWWVRVSHAPDRWFDTGVEECDAEKLAYPPPELVAQILDDYWPMQVRYRRGTKVAFADLVYACDCEWCETRTVWGDEHEFSEELAAEVAPTFVDRCCNLGMAGEGARAG